MNCQYCNQKCIKTMMHHGIGDWTCEPCNTNYIVNWGFTVINMFFNNRKFFYQFSKNRDGSYLYRIVSLTGGEIMKFNEPPNITPQNIDKKAKLYITFS